MISSRGFEKADGQLGMPGHHRLRVHSRCIGVLLSPRGLGPAGPCEFARNGPTQRLFVLAGLWAGGSCGAAMGLCQLRVRWPGARAMRWLLGCVAVSLLSASVGVEAACPAGKAGPTCSGLRCCLLIVVPMHRSDKSVVSVVCCSLSRLPCGGQLPQLQLREARGRPNDRHLAGLLATHQEHLHL